MGEICEVWIKNGTSKPTHIVYSGETLLHVENWPVRGNQMSRLDEIEARLKDTRVGVMFGPRDIRDLLKVARAAETYVRNHEYVSGSFDNVQAYHALMVALAELDEK